MGLADKDKLSCPLLLHMIFSTFCTGFTPVKGEKGSFFNQIRPIEFAPGFLP